MRLMRFRPSPAIAIATLALVVAGAGVGTAASGLISGSQIKAGTITGKQIKAGTITGKQIKNHSVGLNKLSGKLPAGPRGPKGVAGATGSTGPAGPITGTLPTGVTLKGWFNLDTVAAGSGQFNGGSISFGLSLAATPTATIIPVGGSPTAECPGSFAAPSATHGNLCLYESTIANSSGFATIGTNAVGTELFIHSAAAGRFYVDGTWAVTG
jgi:hypothetical protein